MKKLLTYDFLHDKKDSNNDNNLTNIYILMRWSDGQGGRRGEGGYDWSEKAT